MKVSFDPRPMTHGLFVSPASAKEKRPLLSGNGIIGDGVNGMKHAHTSLQE